ncbi:MAG TPA: ribonucleoside-diphosphate reductase, adenosylcobalamin-dependent, partial [Romboutsia sp.]|nr:ribonucleoside-diphosphate reductase, adenosylcobalamin-dependent [Romboutsia sp.]
YGSIDSIRLCDDIGFSMVNEAIHTSSKLAKEFGAYPKYKKESLVKNKFLSSNTNDEVKESVKKYGLRNSQLLTIAPTGTLSTMLGISGGIEPIFDTHYVRKTESLHEEGDVFYTVYTPIVKEYMEANDIQHIGSLPTYFKTAKTIRPIDRVLMQSIWQDHIDASISSTVNLPESSTVEDVIKLYRDAWEHGLKGLTIFRENCDRSGILTSTPEKEEPKVEEVIAETPVKLNSVVPITRKQLGNRLSGTTYVKDMACGKLYITINRDENDNLVEVFIDSGKSGGCSANTESLGRYASACMRCGMDINSIIDATKGVKCSACTKVKGAKTKNIDGMSCGDIIARTIQEEYEMYHGDGKDKRAEVRGHKITVGVITADDVSYSPKTDSTADQILKHIPTKMYCPECGSLLTNSGGCTICLHCGHSKCQ